MHKKILLPIDNSEPSLRAGEYAISAADIDGADIIVLHVIDTHYLNSLPQRDLREKLDKEFRLEGKEAVEKFEKKIEDEKCSGKCKNVKLITMIKEGKPEEVILEVAKDEGVDQIIMGKSSKEGLERVVVGSTAEKVVRGTEVPIIIIP